jgi:hypothetical protein
MINIFLKDDLNVIEVMIKEYYDQFIVESNGITGILLLNYSQKDPLEVYVLNDEWTPATYEEKGLLAKEIKKKLKFDEDTFKWIGYMGNYKGSYDFKVINTELEKLTSAVFENKSATEMYKIINETVEERLYSTATAPFKPQKIQLAIIEELYLRFFDGDVRYFLNKLEIYNLNKKLK